MFDKYNPGCSIIICNIHIFLTCRLNVVVHYDDMFKDQFQHRAVTRIEAIMAIVDEMYSETDTLKTEIDVNLMAIEHAAGKNWGTVDSWDW